MKNALVLSGGGVKGAFEAGVIKALTEKGQSWDIMAGVSAGAINAAFMAQYRPESQALGASALVDLWKSIKDSDIKKRWFPFGKLHSLWTGGLYNTSPLLSLIKKNLSSIDLFTSGVNLSIGAVSLHTGEYKYVSGTEDEIHQWVLASSAFPVAFPPVEINGELWIDGGVKDTTPITDVLAPQVNNIDVVVTSYLGAKLKDQNVKKNPLSIALRAATIMSDEVYNSDLNKVPPFWMDSIKLYQPPSIAILPDDVLEFDPKVIESLIALGYEVGKNG